MLRDAVFDAGVLPALEALIGHESEEKGREASLLVCVCVYATAALGACRVTRCSAAERHVGAVNARAVPSDPTRRGA